MASSPKNDARGSAKKKKLTRLGSFSTQEVFRAWAHDSLLKPKTIEALVEIHQIDSLPAVLALRSRDIANLGLPIGQARLFQEAVIKLHAEYTYQEAPSPATRVDVEVPTYKSMLDDVGSPVERGNRHGDYFRFNNFEISEEMGVEAGEALYGGDKNLLPDEDDDEDDDGDETQSGCACQRWLFISIFMPLILVLSIVGCICWLVLWPINKLCPVGKTFSKIFNAIENLMKLPVISFYWAIGKRRDHEMDPDQESDTRRSYGGVDSLSMHEIDKTNR